MSKTYDRILKPINTIEPRGHSEAVRNRHLTSLRIAAREIEQRISKEMERR